MRLLARSLTYHQVPGTPFPGFRDTERHDNVYRFWETFWTGVLKKNGVDHKPNPDDFLRQTVVGVLEQAGQIVAMHSHSYFDLSRLAPREHSYFRRFFTPDFLQSLRGENVSQVLSMEMYSVSPEWRSPKVGVSLAAVMIALGVKLAQEWDVDAAIGVARMDVGVHNLVQAQGAKVLGSQVEIYKTPCKQIAFFRADMAPHRDRTVAELTEHFWNTRNDATRPHADNVIPIRRAA